jgi:DNA-binding GntR family transcriptional regulator
MAQHDRVGSESGATAQPGMGAIAQGATLTDWRTVAERVAAILRDRIVKGDLAPFDRIVERQVSAELEVSRTPVREALKLLEADGLIEISLHRGAQVAPYRPDDARHLFDVIASLESLAARRLADALAPEVLDRLEALHSSMLDHHRAGRFSDYFDVNTAIHDAVIAGSGNPVLVETHRRLIARARRGRFLAIMDPARLEQAVSEHEALMDALRRRDAGAAAAVWDAHLRNTGDTVADLLSRSALDGAL